jgi:hypothetical protein
MRPRDASGLAAGAPLHWMSGADAVLLAADPALLAQRLEEVAHHCAMAFPGTELPQCAL